VDRKSLSVAGLLALCAALVLALFVSPNSASAEVTGLETKSYTATASPGEIASAAVACSSGKKALGGGVDVAVNPAGTQHILASVPQASGGENSTNAISWLALMRNADTNDHTFTVWVICATVGS
jgi:hypothetical protein